VNPRVSVVVPARNEARYITRCVRSILDQEFEGDLELLVVDGDSDDGTAELAAAAGARVLPNPEATIPAALNRALEAAKADVLLRFDAHAEMPPGYVRACLLVLEDEGAANVGGWREARGEGPWGRAVARALRSPLGVGNSRIWRPPRANEHRRDVDTVPLGCFPTKVLRRIGGWQTDLLANEDFELNARLRANGGRVVFDPAVWSVYRPRESLGGLARQYWNYGWWKAAVLLDRPASLRARQLAPALLLAALGTAAWPGNKGQAGRTALAAYGMLLAGAAVRERGGWRLAAVLATMHVSWGSGVLAGLAARAFSRRSARPPR
jgi:glycosyltransferase involved in cell wall biosynthesis